MVIVLSLSNNNALLKVKVEEDVNSCEALLDEDLSVKTIGLINDIPVTPDDLELPLLKQIQQAILEFSQEQSSKRLRDDNVGCVYRMIQSRLLYSPILMESNEIDESQWHSVVDMSNVDSSIIQKINDYFKANFK